MINYQRRFLSKSGSTYVIKSNFNSIFFKFFGDSVQSIYRSKKKFNTNRLWESLSKTNFHCYTVAVFKNLPTADIMDVKPAKSHAFTH